MRKAGLWIAVILLLLCSCGRVKLKKFEIGVPYVGNYQNSDCAVAFDEVEQGVVKGRVYLGNGMSVAPLNFSVELGNGGDGYLYIGNEGKRLSGCSMKKGHIRGMVDDVSFSVSLSDVSDELPYKAEYKGVEYEFFMNDMVYAERVKGYWESYLITPGDDDYVSIYSKKLPLLMIPTDLDLDLDLYRPIVDEKHKRQPLLVLIHGGAFYGSDKRSEGFPEMAEYFARRGYVVASINYRMGFWPWGQSVDRAGYRAVQDANAALRFLVSKSDEYNIDTANIFVAGSSAGAVTALNLAFMREENRPEASYSMVSENFKNVLGLIMHYMFNWDVNIVSLLGLDVDLGEIASLNPEIQVPFRVKAVVNMWGAVHDLDMLGNSKNTAILSFHGDADEVLPYTEGYPFNDVLDDYWQDIMEAISFHNESVYKFLKFVMPSDEALNEFLFRKMYGSKMIDGRAKLDHMRRSELHTFEGGGHSLHLNGDGTLSDYFIDTILPVMNCFLCEEVTGVKAVRLVQAGAWFEARDINDVKKLQWQVEGGVVVDREGDNRVKVMFFSDAPRHSVKVGGKYRSGVEFREEI